MNVCRFWSHCRLCLLAVLLTGTDRASAQAITDYDDDNNGLIDIRTLAQLNAMRWDLDGDGVAASNATTTYNAAFPNPAAGMGCPDTADAGSEPGPCLGYELRQNLDFDTDGDGSTWAGATPASDADDTYHNGGGGWPPIGSQAAPFNTTFEGNGMVIWNLFISRSANYIGLFGSTGTSSVIASVGLANARVQSTYQGVGALVGFNQGRIAAAWSSGSVQGGNAVGGLLGQNHTATGAVVASYSVAAVRCTNPSSSFVAGGLVGFQDGSARIVTSYAAGAVTGACGRKHGIVARDTVINVTSTYWDVDLSEIDDDNDADPPEGRSTVELRTPTAYGTTTLYSAWDDVDVDGDGVVGVALDADDDVWNFGTDREHPVLKAANFDTALQFNSQGTDLAPAFGTSTVAARTYHSGLPIEPFVVPPASSGNGALVYAAAGLPVGLTFDADGAGACSAERTVCGRPTTAGSSTTTITVVDSDDNTHASDRATLTFTVTVLQFSAPAAPARLTAAPLDAQAVLRWRDPSDGTITGYSVRSSTSTTFADTWTAIPDSASTTVTYTVPNLANGTRYYFQVRATNAAGHSAPSNTATVQLVESPSAAVVISDANLRAALGAELGKAPTATITRLDMAKLIGALDLANEDISVLTGLEHAVNVTVLNLQNNSITDVTALASLTSLTSLRLDGNSIVTALLIDADPSTVEVDAGPLVLHELSSHPANRKRYTVRLAALPTAPVTVTVASGDRAVTVDEGGTPRQLQLTFATSTWSVAQTVTATAAEDDDAAAERVALSHTASGAYYANVMAELMVITVDDDPPATPTGLTAAPLDAQAALRWTDPLDGAITGYLVRHATSTTALASSTWTAIPDSASSTVAYTVPNLTNGARYYFQIRATNAVGDSPPSNTATIQLADTPAAVVAISDANLRAALEAKLRKVPRATITQLDMAKMVGHLELISRNISVLTGLEHAVNVTEIYLQSNSITDVTALANLTSLTWLDLSNNSIRDVRALGSLTSLTTLWLHNNLISDVTALGRLTSLTTLWLQDNRISDVQALGNLTSLTTLLLNNNSIRDVTPLGNLAALTTLYLHDNSIRDVTPLGNLASLTTLYLNDNLITDVTPLASLALLATLRLNGNSIVKALLIDADPSTVGVDAGPLALHELSTHPANEKPYTVRLAALPAAAVTVTVTSSDRAVAVDADSTPWQLQLTFATSTWSVTQTVTATAAEDDDALTERVTLSHTASGSYYTNVVAELVATTEDDDAPTVPPQWPGLTALALDAQVLLRWRGLPDSTITGYSLRYATSTTALASGAWTAISGSASSTVAYTVPNLTNGTRYHFQIRATNAAGHSPPSNTATAQLADIPSAAVAIPDANLRAALEAKLGKAPGATITQLDMAQLVGVLTLTNENISVLTGLERAVNVRSLGLRRNAIRDVTALGDLTSLTSLSLGRNEIGDVTALGGLASLTYLDLGRNRITDVTALGDLAALEFLFLESNSIADVTPLASLTALTRLRLDDNPIDTAFLIDADPSTDEVDAGPLTLHELSSHPANKKRYTVRLAALSTAPVTVTVTSGDPAVTVDSDGTPQQRQLTFATSTWNVAQTVTATAVEDANRSDEQVALSHRANLCRLYLGNRCIRPSIYAGVRAELVVTTVDYPPAPPAAPAGLTATPLDAQALLRWTDPSDGTVTGYSVRSSTSTTFADTWTAISGSASSTVTHTVPNLTNGARYYFQIRATNAAGASAPSNTATVRLADSPAAAVEISDANLRTALEDELGKASGATITQLDMAQLIDALDLINKSISVLTGLESAVNVTTLKLSGNSIRNVDALGGLTSLRVLWLDNNEITDVTALGRLTSLTALYLRNNAITDVTPLANLAALATLRLEGNSILKALVIDAAPSTAGVDAGPLVLHERASHRANKKPYTVRLATLPTAAVTVTVTSGDPAVTVDSDSTPRQLQLTFATSTWRAAQTVMAAAAEDDDSLAERVTLSHAASGSYYLNVVAELVATTVDDDTPAAPAGLTATPFDAQALLRWRDPLDGTITGYLVRHATSTIALASSTWTAIPDSASSTVAHTVPNLTNGARYYFQVRATNVAGDGPPSNTATTQLADAPAAAAAISDANLRAALRSALGKAPGATITQLDLAQLNGALNLANESISVLTGLEHAINVTTLRLQNNAITDVTPLGNLTSLTTLQLDNNAITDVRALGGLTALTTLLLSGNDITDVTALGRLASLRVLDLRNNAIMDVTPLANLAALATLRLDGNSITKALVIDADPSTVEVDAGPLVLHELPSHPANKKRYTVRLATLPTAPVTVMVTSSDAAVTVGSDSTPRQLQLTFATSTWRVAQTVTAAAAEDDDRAAERVVLAHTASGAYYANVVAELVATTVDDDTPAAPVGLTAAPLDAQAALEWRDPSDGTITGYSVRSSTSTTFADTWTAISGSASSTVAHTVRNLTNGARHYFQIRATNAAGDGPPSNTATTQLAGSPAATVAISDANLRNALEDELGKAPRAPITQLDMARLNGVLDLAGESISVLTGLEYAVNVTTLRLQNNSITDVTPLGDLDSLTTLFLSGNDITDVTALGRLASLTVLDLRNNAITDVTPLAGLAALTRLRLDGNSIMKALVIDADPSTVEVDAGPVALHELSSHPANEKRYTVRLAALPTAAVTVTVTSGDPAVTVDADGTPQQLRLTFATSTWSVAQTVTATAAEDDDALAERVVLSHTASGSYYTNVVAELVATTVDDDPPAAPAGLTAAPLDAQAVLRWRNPSDGAITGYSVRYATSTTALASSLWTAISGSNSSTVAHTVRNLANGTRYYFQIRATDAAVDSAPSDIATTRLAGSPTTAVAISDGKLRAALEAKLGKVPGATITQLDMARLVGALDLANKSISVLTGLEHAVNVTVLQLQNNSITDVTALGHLTSLTVLSLARNTIRNVTALGRLTALTSLWLEHNSITDVAALGRLAALTVLDLSNNEITDVAALGRLTSLTTLFLQSNSITDVTALAGLTSLTWLRLDGNSIVTALVIDADPSTDEVDAGPLALYELSSHPANRKRYTVRLAALPTTAVTVTVTSGGRAVTVDEGGTPRQLQLTFATSTWSVAQTVTATATKDDDASAEQVALSHAASGSYYANVVAELVAMVTDHDARGLALAATSTLAGLDENTSTTYTVALATVPTGPVTVTIASSDTTAATVRVAGSPHATLTFTTSTWSTARTVTVAAQDDADGTDETITLTHDPHGSDYRSVSAATLRFTLDDDDPRGVTLSTSTLFVQENGSATYTVRLRTRPVGGIVTVTISGAGRGITASPTSLTFMATNWDTAQPVRVDAAKDANSAHESVVLMHTPSGAGTDYDSGVSAEDLTATAVDNDMPRLQVTPPSLTVDEGRTGTYTVRLSTDPSGDVTVAVGGTTAQVTADADGDRANGDQHALMFTTTTWNTAQTVTVSAAEDDDATDGAATLTHTATGASAYVGLNAADRPAVQVTVDDDDTPGILIDADPATPDPDTGPLAVTENQSAEYTVRLATQPTTTVTVTATSSDAALAVDTDASPQTRSLTFSTSTWATPQTVTARAAGDDDGGDEAATIAHAAVGGDYGVTQLLAVQVSDDDERAVAVAAAVTLNEGSTASSSVRLTARPTGPVTVAITTPHPDVTVQAPAVLTFSSSTWNTAQTFTIRAGEDDDGEDETATLTLDPHGADYTDVAAATSTVNLVDDDPRGVTLSVSMLSVPEGASADYAMRLNTQPVGGDVTVSVGGAGRGITASSTALTFTGVNWRTLQTVTVSAVEDDNPTPESVDLTHAVAGADYGREGVTAGSVRVTTTDNDTPSLYVSPTALTLTEEGASGTYAVRLNTLPTGAVTVTVGGTTAAVAADADGATPGAQMALTFTTSTWSVAQTVTVSAPADDDATNATTTLTHAATGADYTSLAPLARPGVQVTVNDDDAPNILIDTKPATSEIDGGALALRENDSAQYTVRLATQPTGPVTVTATSADPALQVDADASPLERQLMFSTSTWATPQTVTARALDDDDGGDETTVIAHAAVGGDYDDVTQSLTAQVSDDDERAVAAAAAVTLHEGGMASSTVRLATRPTGPVTVAVTIPHPDVTVQAPAVLTFSSSTWNTAQTFTIRAGEDDDGEDETATLTLDPHGADYTDVAAATSTVNLLDDDPRGVMLSVSMLSVPEGGQRGLRDAAEHAAGGRRRDGERGRRRPRHHGQLDGADVHWLELAHAADGDGERRGGRQPDARERRSDARGGGRGLRQGRRDGRQREGDDDGQRQAEPVRVADRADAHRGGCQRHLRGAPEHAADRCRDGDGGRHDRGGGGGCGRSHAGRADGADVHDVDVERSADGDGERAGRRRRDERDDDADARDDGRGLHESGPAGATGRAGDGERRRRAEHPDRHQAGHVGDRRRRAGAARERLSAVHRAAGDAADRAGDGDGHQRRSGPAGGRGRQPARAAADVLDVDLGHTADGDGEGAGRRRRWCRDSGH